MKPFRLPRSRALAACMCWALLGVSWTSHAGLILSDTYYQFGFGDAGSLATGCDPADPSGAFCVPSSGTLTTFGDAPPWSFVAPVGGSELTVTDAFESGDRFEIFDFGASLGLTSAPVLGGDCGDDPVTCLADPNISHNVFLLGAGAHEITIVPVESPSDGGAGYFAVSAAAAIPEPSLLALLAAGSAGLLLARRARRTH